MASFLLRAVGVAVNEEKISGKQAGGVFGEKLDVFCRAGIIIYILKLKI